MVKGGLMRQYLLLMEKHPLPMQMVQTGILLAAGDILAQTQLEKKRKEDINWHRTQVYALTGIFFIAPVVSRWYVFIEKTFKGKSDIVTTVKKMLMDQLCFAPAMLPAFVTITGFLQYKSWDQIKSELEKNYFEILLANYKVWPAIQVFNFYFVPLNYRVLLVQAVSLLWNAYLSFKVK